MQAASGTKNEREDRTARSPEADGRIGRAYSFSSLSAYTLRQRLLIRAADLVFYLLIRVIGRSVRFSVEGREHLDEATREGSLPIYACWHDRVFLATYFFRERGIIVMTSQSFDGEYIARFIQRFGFGAVRGSSTRGGVGALVELIRLVRSGRPAGFLIDGPKGPRHVAKPGATLLAKKTGQPVLPFSVNAESFWEIPSWDRFRIPKPFTRATVRIAAPIRVSKDANDEELEEKRAELQNALDRLSV